MKEGILIGADQGAEELLPWWWERYRALNDKQVAVVDLGMTKQKRLWCESRMQVIPFSEHVFSIEAPGKILPYQLKRWTKRYRGLAWKVREAWFKKPFACLLSPFDRTLWLDLDCEVCSSLSSLFNEWEEGIELAIAREDIRISKQEMFNSGVFLFQKGSPLIHEWKRLSEEQNGTMMGDQDVLTALLLTGKFNFKELSPLYNWLMYGGFCPGIIIAHWAGRWGKEYIKRFGGLIPLRNQLLD